MPCISMLDTLCPGQTDDMPESPCFAVLYPLVTLKSSSQEYLSNSKAINPESTPQLPPLLDFHSYGHCPFALSSKGQMAGN